MLSAKDRNQPYFIEHADGSFSGQDPARGPWSVAHCHAGPVAGLMARAMERVEGGGKSLARLTVEVLRPVPLDGFTIAASIRRMGRTVTTTQADLCDGDGKLCASATGLHLTRVELDSVPSVPTPPLDRNAAVPGAFPLSAAAHPEPAFAHFVDIAYPPGQTGEIGPTNLWMRTPPLLSGETPSPFQVLCPLADCGNGISRNADMPNWQFMNVDLSIHMHRAPVSDWLHSASHSIWENSGIGLSHAVISDEGGPVAVALQTIVVRRGTG